MISSIFIPGVDEVEVRKCYVDVDRKFKGEHGITLIIPQWRKLIKAVKYIDQKIKAIQEKSGSSSTN